MAELVHLDILGRTAWITLDSPSNRNALSTQLVAELMAHLDTAVNDKAIRTVLLTATGSTFCSGADLKEPPTDQTGAASPPAVMSAIWNCPKPVVVALNGHARAGGIGLLAAADLVVTPTTANFAFSEVRIGVAPAVIGVICVRRMSPRGLSRYLLTGEVFDAWTAVDIGLVTVATPPSEFDAVVAGMLEMLAVGEPHALAMTKQLIRDLPELSVEDGFAHAAPLSAALFASPSAAEGIAALREKRPASWV